MKVINVDGIGSQIEGGSITVPEIFALAGLVGDDHVLVRIDEGRAVHVPADRPLTMGDAEAASFRTFHRGRIRHLRVNGESWDWGGPAIREDEVRSIAGLADGEELLMAGGRGPLPSGCLIDLAGEWPVRLESRPTVQTQPQPQVPIVVNGRQITLERPDVSFEDLVGLAFPGRDLATSGSRALTVTYRRGPADRPEGSLISREAVRVQSGEVFNVTATDKS